MGHFRPTLVNWLETKKHTIGLFNSQKPIQMQYWGKLIVKAMNSWFEGTLIGIFLEK